MNQKDFIIFPINNDKKIVWKINVKPKVKGFVK